MKQPSLNPRGTKRNCPKCGTKYYDLNKSPPVCPKCGTVYSPDQYLKSRRIRSSVTEDSKNAKRKHSTPTKQVVSAKGTATPDESDDLDLDLENLDIDALDDGDVDDEDSLGDDDSTDIVVKVTPDDKMPE